MSTALDFILLHRALQSSRDTWAQIQLTINIYSSEKRPAGEQWKVWNNCVSSGYCNQLLNCNEYGLIINISASSALIFTWYMCKNRSHIKTPDQRTVCRGAVKSTETFESSGYYKFLLNRKCAEIALAASGASISTWHACEKRTH